MRVQSAVPMHNGGWLHRGAEPKKEWKPAPKAEQSHINATAMMRDWKAKTKDEWLVKFAGELGLCFDVLVTLGCAWAAPHRAFAFPMKDQHGNTIGVRLRNRAGDKWAVKGSRAGLFYSPAFNRSAPAYVCEGPTDAAAGLMIGLNVVGRPSCLGQEDMLVDLLRHSVRVMIISDNDEPGWNGANRLVGMLRCPSLIWLPPAKDLREFVKCGGDKSLIDVLSGALVWTRKPDKNDPQKPCASPART